MPERPPLSSAVIGTATAILGIVHRLRILPQSLLLIPFFTLYFFLSKQT